MTTLKKIAKRGEVGVLIPLLLLWVITGCFNKNFFSSMSMLSLFRSISVTLIGSVGATFVFSCGMMDLSIGAVYGLASMVACLLIGVSTACPQSLQVSRQQSVRALCRQDARSAICHYEDQPLPHGVENLFVAGETTLLECLQSGNIVQTESAVHKCFATLPGWIAFSSVRNQVFELLLALNRRSGAQLFEDIPGAVSEKLQCCQSRRELEDCVLNLCRECIRRNQDSDSLWQEDVIQRARRYIDACYNAEISLEETAEAVGVSKFYLSRLFKLRLGTNYSTYLTEKRVHMAASLIEAQRELSNREIAERVGFRDPDYFGKVFKRAFGCTVSEYREKNYEGGNRT